MTDRGVGKIPDDGGTLPEWQKLFNHDFNWKYKITRVGSETRKLNQAIRKMVIWHSMLYLHVEVCDYSIPEYLRKF